MPISSQEARAQTRASLGLPQKPEPQPTIPIEGHVCDFPLWSYSRKRGSIKTLHIVYDDGSFCTIEALKGMPGPSFPGYLDVILFFGQGVLFERNCVEISVYSIFQKLGIDSSSGRNYQNFRFDMEKSFAVILKTDRFRDPITGERSYVDYFRILQRMRLAKHRQGTSVFYFDDRKTLRLPRCLRRGGMRAFGGGLNAPCQRQVVGVQWRYGPPTHPPCRLRYAIPLGLVAQVPTRCVAR